tara:strand:- start:703 stop:1596 length:894 start_codon:yes stop_codon:yes gene_type:complete
VSTDPLLRLSGVSKYYGKHCALENITFDVHAGQVVGLMGHNGAGKSTCLKASLGLIQAGGSIELLGLEPLKNRSKLLESVAYISDISVLPDWATTNQLMAYMNAIHPSFDEDRLIRMLKLSNVPLNNRIKTFSKGMVTQLYLALILSIDCRLLVLDEPTLGLDVLMKSRFYQYLTNHYDLNTGGIIISSHQVEELEDFLTHVVILQDGHIILKADIDTLFKRFKQVKIQQDTYSDVKKQCPSAIIVQYHPKGRCSIILDSDDESTYAAFGQLSQPKLRDIFIYLIKQNGQTDTGALI